MVVYNVTVGELNTTWMNITNLHSGNNSTADFALPAGTGDEGAALCEQRCIAVGTCAQGDLPWSSIEFSVLRSQPSLSRNLVDLGNDTLT